MRWRHGAEPGGDDNRGGWPGDLGRHSVDTTATPSPGRSQGARTVVKVGHVSGGGTTCPVLGLACPRHRLAGLSPRSQAAGRLLRWTNETHGPWCAERPCGCLASCATIRGRPTRQGHLRSVSPVPSGAFGTFPFSHSRPLQMTNPLRAPRQLGTPHPAEIGEILPTIPFSGILRPVRSTPALPPPTRPDTRPPPPNGGCG